MSTVLSPPEARVILHNISWSLYEQLLAAHEIRVARALSTTVENWRSRCPPMSTKS